MSVEWITWAFKQRQLKEPGPRFVLVVLANHADQRGYSWPSQEYISLSTGQSERTVRDALKRLEELGYIQRYERRRHDGRKSSTGYQLITSPAKIAGETSPADSAAEVAGDKSATGKSSPADFAGLHRQKLPVHIGEPPSGTVNIPPKPPKLTLPRFNIEHYLLDGDRDAVRMAARGYDTKALAAEFNCWVFEQGIQVSQPVKLFLKFIATWIEKEKRHG